MGFISKQFLDIIEWTDNTQDTMVYKFPMEDNEIQSGGKLIIRPSQAAIFISEGKIADIFTEPGTYDLNTQSLPILGDLKGWKFGFKSQFKSDVYFVSLKKFIGQKWGTKQPVAVVGKYQGNDINFRVRAFGTYGFKISDIKGFMENIVGTDEMFTIGELGEELVSKVEGNMNVALAQCNVSPYQVVAQQKNIEVALKDFVSPEIAELGLELTSFSIQSISLLDEFAKQAEQFSAAQMQGGIDNYVKFGMVSAMQDSASNPSANSTMQAGVGMAMGMNMGNMFANNMNPNQQQNPSQPVNQNNAGSIKCSCGNLVADTAKFCPNCGTPIQKPSKQFCPNCGKEVQTGAKFCGDCGTSLNG